MGLEPTTSGSAGQFLKWLDYRDGFIKYVKRYNPNTAKTLVNYLDRYVRIIRSPLDVMNLFNGLSVGQKHHLNRSLRAFFNFAEIMGSDKEWLDRLRKAIPKDKIGIDLRVPEETEIIESLRKATEMTLKYQALWNLCLDSGVRLIEAVNLINTFDPGRLQRVNGFYRYEIGAFRESKQAYYAYFTEHTLGLIQSVNGEKIIRPNASHYYSKIGVTSPKYLRKFAFDRMIELEIPESVADFIEGRVPKRIGAKHYMVLMRQADRFYGRYASYLESLRSRL